MMENGHGTTRNQVIAEIEELGLFPHEWTNSKIPLGLAAYDQSLHLFVIGGELEIEVDGFPFSAVSGSYVRIPANQVHELKQYDNAQVYVGINNADIGKLKRIHVPHI